MPMSHSNKVLCSLNPKKQSDFPTAIYFGVSLAVCLSNSGLEYTVTSLLKNAGLEFDMCLQRYGAYG